MDELAIIAKNVIPVDRTIWLMVASKMKEGFYSYSSPHLTVVNHRQKIARGRAIFCAMNSLVGDRFLQLQDEPDGSGCILGVKVV